MIIPFLANRQQCRTIQIQIHTHTNTETNVEKGKPQGKFQSIIKFVKYSKYQIQD